MAPNKRSKNSKESSITEDSDIARERRINESVAKLKEMFEKNPELAGRTQAMLAGDLPCPDLENKMIKEVQLSMRIPADLLDRADLLVPFMEDDPALKAWRVSRSSVIRSALLIGLEKLEAKYGVSEEEPKPTNRKK